MWTLKYKHGTRDRVWRIERPGTNGAFAATITHEPGDVERVTVKLEAPSIPYAQAEAARLFAVAQDAVADGAYEAPPIGCEATLDLTPRCPIVSLRGHDALTIVACHFGVEEDLL